MICKVEERKSMSKVEGVSRGSSGPEKEVLFGLLREKESNLKHCILAREQVLDDGLSTPPKKASRLIWEKLAIENWSQKWGLGWLSRRL